MTAFSRINARVLGDKWTVEIRSLNHRYFDFSLKMPAHLYVFEDKIRDMVQRALRRGKVSVSITYSGQRGKGESVTLDGTAVRGILAAVRAMKEQFKLRGDIEVRDLLGLPRIFSAEKKIDQPDRYWKTLKISLGKVIRSTVKARELEGRKLSKDIMSRLNGIESAISCIEKNVQDQPKRYFDKINKRFQELMGDPRLEISRIHQEVALLAERSDITEEIVRTRSHIGLFRSRLSQNSEAGREFEFLCQELQREVNTMSAKAQLFEVSAQVIFIKTELEKIREQIQNVE